MSAALIEWVARLKREATCSVVDHQPRECAELAALIEAELGPTDTHPVASAMFGLPSAALGLMGGEP